MPLNQLFPSLSTYAWVTAPLGFANPMIYLAAQRFPSSFNDVLVGSNACGVISSDGDAQCCTNGFQAAYGWDPGRL